MTNLHGILGGWVSRRHQLARAVDAASKGVNPRLRVKGSFLHRNFHLLRDGITTFSDVDLLLAPDGRNRHAWERDVEIALARLGWHLRVSVQHFDSLEGIKPSDSRLLAHGELIRFFPRCSDQRFAAYIYAKTTLSILGTLQPDKLQTMRTRSPYELSLARSARLGFECEFGARECRILLSGLDKHFPVVAQHLELMESGDTHAAQSWFFKKLKSSSVHPWLKERLRLLIKESLT